MAKDTRTRMLETTARLLQHRGYFGTALSDILRESNAPRGSLYFHFPGGKDQLVIEATRLAVEETSHSCARPSPRRGARGRRPAFFRGGRRRSSSRATTASAARWRR